jgi:fermentation-respiration switch protein FrsA (DUF1100 family)
MSLQSILFLSLFFLLMASLWTTRMFRRSIDRSQKQFLNRSSDLKSADYSIYRENHDWLEAQEPTILQIEALDNTSLSAYFISHPHAQLGVILVHGYSSSAKAMSTYARYYYDKLNASILMIDLRAHGLSGGSKIGFGYNDRLDLPLWMSQLRMHLPKQIPIVLHGVSMGASTILYTLADGIENVSAVISDSAYIDLKPIFKRQIQMIYKLPTQGVMSLVSLLMRINNGFFLHQTQVLRNLNTTLPILIMHGELDRFVPVEMAQQLFQHYKGDKTLYIAPNALHAMTYAIDRDRYEKTIALFLKRHLHLSTE